MIHIQNVYIVDIYSRFCNCLWPKWNYMFGTSVVSSWGAIHRFPHDCTTISYLTTSATFPLFVTVHCTDIPWVSAQFRYFFFVSFHLIFGRCLKCQSDEAIYVANVCFAYVGCIFLYISLKSLRVPVRSIMHVTPSILHFTDTVNLICWKVIGVSWQLVEIEGNSNQFPMDGTKLWGGELANSLC